ncbi:unnamed protein product [marine sediment metagenome]|uniref:Uncharacterized protein n=1 Tax=marine sediment metagenome TaxID=412755 RepID=X1PLW3_9ZZZZ
MKKLAIILVVFLFTTCEVFENPYNIEINNSYCDGRLEVYNTETNKQLVGEFMPIGSTKGLDVSPGHYFVWLRIDCREYPDKRDRIFYTLISSEYTFCKMTFRKE